MRDTAAMAQTIYVINEYFGVGVISAVMDGAAPELNPGRVQDRKSVV